MDTDDRLNRTATSAAVTPLGWRHVLGTCMTSVPVDSLARAVEVATAVAGVGGPDGRVRLDLRHDRVEIVVSPEDGMTARDVALVERITAALPDHGPGTARTVQLLEIAIDALDIPAIRPFWRAVLGYAEAPDGSLFDPIGQGPAVWFQQMDAPRPQRNRIHLDVSVPHDEAAARIEATLAAGGKLLSDVEAPAFWVLADPEGNEACVTTWQGRD